jgi:hypothetical protein
MKKEGEEMAQHWKKNLNKIPDSIREKVNQIGDSNIVIACSMKIKTEDILSGVYRHLNIRIVDGKLEYPKQVLPSPESGRYSRYNLYGCEKVHRDEPKVSRSYSVETPNYGDWHKGYHEVSWDRAVYQRDFIGPRYIELTLESLGIDNKNNHVLNGCNG